MGNYRPITLVDYVSKVFEKLVLRRLERHLDTLNFFVPSQFGFRRSRSTDLALAHMWQEVTDCVEGNQVCLGVFLDVAAAFNCLNHTYFLQMLENIGSDELTVRWFGSFLSNRIQSVVAGGTTSASAELNIGTPQGSVLGPYVFIILVNYVLLAIGRQTSCKVITYADDTTLLFRLSPSRVAEEAREIGSLLDSLVEAFNTFGLNVNTEKTGVTLFRSSGRNICLETLTI